MEYKFVWGDGTFDYSPVNSGVNHADLLVRTFGSGIPRDLTVGNFTDDGGVTIMHGAGLTEDELRFLISQELERYDKRSYHFAPITAANVEDTEPEYNFGFLTEPHSMLYPCAFENEKMRPEALKKIKSYVLDAVGMDSDAYIYMTVYGSGASYNWDETGDFDVQMWVDIDAYNKQNPDVPLTSDELLDMVRRGVQTVNFPSFKQLGLETEDCAGDMLIQYYAKPGKGTPEENLASKPYSCYDMEQDDWLQKPEPITPEFYGDMFLLVQSKAHDIAEQAEALFSQFQRNILNWQFWTQLGQKYDHADYRAAAEDSRTNATLEQQGIATLFEGVFGGRKEAYSEEGEGMRDERDLVQKMLEVWGIFQKLKHYARAPLPWDEQEMPESKESRNWREVTDVLKSHNYPSYGGTFGYIGGKLIIGTSHHQAIIASLLNKGWTWEQLFNEEQAWGWWDVVRVSNEEATIAMSFTSDSGRQDNAAVEKAIDAMEELTGTEVKKSPYAPDGVVNEDEYGSGLGGKGYIDQYYTGPGGEARLEEYVRTDLPYPPKTSAVGDPKSNYKEKGLPASMCFGYIADTLLIGQKHHQQIMARLFAEGWDWLDMFEQEQAWGWAYVDDYEHYIDVRFTSDAGVQTPEAKEKAVQAFRDLYGIEDIRVNAYEKGKEDAEGYGAGLRGRQNVDIYMQEGSSLNNILKDVIGEIPPPPSKEYVPTNPPDPELWKWFNETFGPMTQGQYPEPEKSDTQKWFEDQSWIGEEGYEYKQGETPEWFHDMFQHAAMGPVPVGCVGTVVKYANQPWVIHGKLTPGANPEGMMGKSEESDWNKVPGQSDSCPIHGTAMWCYHIDSATEGTWAIPQDKSQWTQWNPIIYAAADYNKTSGLQKFADWNDLMEKAQRLRDEGGVEVIRNAPDTVAGRVQGDHDTYDTQIWRDDPNSQAITMWDCGCQWSDYSWGRTRQWKKYEGRPCSHALALFWEAQGMPVEDAESGSNAPQPVPGGGMQDTMDVTPMMQPFDPSDLIAPFGTPQTDGAPESVPMVGDEALMEPVPVTQPQPAYSQPTVPKDTSPFGIPGALSKVAAFANGQIVRGKVPLYGEEPTTGTPHIIPQNTSGEVLYSDETTTVVIFPLAGSYLTPHLVKVECETSELYADPKAQPFIKKKHHSGFSEWKEEANTQE